MVNLGLWTDKDPVVLVSFFFYSELVMKLQSINTAKLGSPVAIRLDSSKFLVLDDKLLGYNAKDKLSHHEQVRLTSFARSFVSTCVCTD